MSDAASALLGLGASAQDLTFVQISLRAVIVSAVTLVMIRLAHRRFLAQLSTFDSVVVFLLASMLARAVNGTASFFPTLGGGFVIVGIHRLLGTLAVQFPRFGDLIKGRPDVLVRQGRMLDDRLKAHGVSRADVLEEARLNGCVDHERDIALATLERNGQVSIVPARPGA